GNSQSMSIPSKIPGQRLMNTSSAEPAKRFREASVRAASENLADPPQPPIEIARRRCGKRALSFLSSPKLPPATLGQAAPLPHAPTSTHGSDRVTEPFLAMSAKA